MIFEVIAQIIEWSMQEGELNIIPSEHVAEAQLILHGQSSRNRHSIMDITSTVCVVCFY
jgi:hypothetical protein